MTIPRSDAQTSRRPRHEQPPQLRLRGFFVSPGHAHPAAGSDQPLRHDVRVVAVDVLLERERSQVLGLAVAPQRWLRSASSVLSCLERSALAPSVLEPNLPGQHRQLSSEQRSCKEYEGEWRGGDAQQQ